MAYDYIYTPNANLETGKPGRAVDIRAIRDMAPASMEGASGAPGLKVRALERSAPGDVVRLENPAAETTGAAISRLTFTALGWGSVRMKVEARRPAGSGGAVVVTRIRAGVTTTLASSTPTGSWAEYTFDVPFEPGDGVSIGASGGVNLNMRGGSACTNGSDLWCIPNQNYAVTPMAPD